MQHTACTLFLICLLHSTRLVLAVGLRRDVVSAVPGITTASTHAKVTNGTERYLAYMRVANDGIDAPMTSSDNAAASQESLPLFIEAEIPGREHVPEAIVDYPTQGTTQHDNDVRQQTTATSEDNTAQKNDNALMDTGDSAMTGLETGNGDVFLQSTGTAVAQVAQSNFIAPAYTTAAEEAGVPTVNEEVSMHTAPATVAEATRNDMWAPIYEATTEHGISPSQESLSRYSTEAVAAEEVTTTEATAENVDQIIGRCGSDDASKSNLLSDGGFECMTGGPNFNETCWSFPEGSTPFNEFYQSGNASLRVPYAFNSTIVVVQTIRLEGDTALPIYAQAFVTYDDNSVPVAGMEDSDHSLRVHLIDSEGTTIQREIITFNQNIPWQWTPTVREIRPVAPYRQIKVELFYHNDRAKRTVGQQGYIWYDVVAVRFKATAGQSSNFPAVVDNVGTSASVEGSRNDSGSSSASQTKSIIIGCTASICVVVLAVLVAFLWRWRSRSHRDEAAWNVPHWVGPDHAPSKENADKMGDRRSMYSVGTNLSEQVRQWRVILARTENKRKFHRDPNLTSGNGGAS